MAPPEPSGPGLSLTAVAHSAASGGAERGEDERRRRCPGSVVRGPGDVDAAQDYLAWMQANVTAMAPSARRMTDRLAEQPAIQHERPATRLPVNARPGRRGTPR
jgi:hypothetical protein